MVFAGGGLPAYGESQQELLDSSVGNQVQIRTEVPVVEQSLKPVGMAAGDVTAYPNSISARPASAQPQSTSRATATTVGAQPGAVGQPVTQLPFQAPLDESTTEDVPMTGMEREYQMQLLQQEVQMLRGMVEELQHQFQRFKQTQDDRYLDLDGRLQTLNQPGTAVPLPSGAVSPRPSLPALVPGEPVNAAMPTEKALYDTARELIGNRQYDLAISQLQAVIDTYPDGIYAANAYYWLGEVYLVLATPNYEKARQAFSQVISFFPSHRKVPDAAFKLGMTYHLMGDCSQARKSLDQVVAQYQGRAVAKLAANYLRDKMANCNAG